MLRQNTYSSSKYTCRNNRFISIDPNVETLSEANEAKQSINACVPKMQIWTQYTLD